ncbi:MAG: hypothetical protein ACXVA0_24940 [Mucilaginibacter sp.]
MIKFDDFIKGGTPLGNAIGIGAVHQRAKLTRVLGKTALKSFHPGLLNNRLFCRRILGCYSWILLPKSDGVILSGNDQFDCTIAEDFPSYR